MACGGTFDQLKKFVTEPPQVLEMDFSYKNVPSKSRRQSIRQGLRQAEKEHGLTRENADDSLKSGAFGRKIYFKVRLQDGKFLLRESIKKTDFANHILQSGRYGYGAHSNIVWRLQEGNGLLVLDFDKGRSFEGFMTPDVGKSMPKFHEAKSAIRLGFPRYYDDLTWEGYSFIADSSAPNFPPIEGQVNVQNGIPIGLRYVKNLKGNNGKDSKTVITKVHYDFAFKKKLFPVNIKINFEVPEIEGYGGTKVIDIEDARVGKTFEDEAMTHVPFIQKNPEKIRIRVISNKVARTKYANGHWLKGEGGAMVQRRNFAKSLVAVAIVLALSVPLIFAVKKRTAKG